MNIVEKMEDYEAAPWDSYHGAIPWDEDDDHSSDCPEEQAEWDAVEIYERNLGSHGG